MSSGCFASVGHVETCDQCDGSCVMMPLLHALRHNFSACRAYAQVALSESQVCVQAPEAFRRARPGEGS